jgi:hypothetical protein
LHASGSESVLRVEQTGVVLDQVLPVRRDLPAVIVPAGAPSVAPEFGALGASGFRKETGA